MRIFRIETDSLQLGFLFLNLDSHQRIAASNKQQENRFIYIKSQDVRDIKQIFAGWRRIHSFFN